MELKRTPFQGVLNIIRFNWHFYVMAGLVLLAVFFFKNYLPEQIQGFALLISILAGLSIIISLLTSFYIYDLSNLYQLQWLPTPGNKRILTINAGFDETTEIIKGKFPNCNITACDFYDPSRHTEVSLQRARKAYPSPRNTIQITTNRLPFADNSFDFVVCSLFLHHLTDEKAVVLLAEMKRVARNRIFAIDLHRSPVAYYFYKVVGSIFLQRFTVEDGSLSILRAFKPNELENLARAAGLKEISVSRSAAYRLVLSGK